MFHYWFTFVEPGSPAMGNANARSGRLILDAPEGIDYMQEVSQPYF